MACDATCVGTPSSLYTSRGDSASASVVFGSKNKMSVLSTSVILEDTTYRLTSRSRNVPGPCPPTPAELKSGSTNISFEQVEPRRDISEKLENHNYLPHNSLEKDMSEMSLLTDTSDGHSKKELTKEFDSNLPQFSEPTAQNEHLGSQYKIPQIFLEPPTSPGYNSTVGVSADELSKLPSQNGLLYFDSWYSDGFVGQHNLMTSTDTPRSALSSDPSVALPSRYQKRLQQDLDNGNVLEEEEDASDSVVVEDDINQREEDLGTALKWIRQEILVGSGSSSVGNSNTTSSIDNNNTTSSIGNNNTTSSIGNSNTTSSIGNGNTNSSIGNSNTTSSTGNSNTTSSIGNSNTTSSIGNSNTTSSIGNSNTTSSIGNNNTTSSIGNNNTNSSIGNNNTTSSIGNSNTTSSIGNSNTLH
ncbi:carboxylesterase 1C-like isoform X2 [Elysia marginata]|uniref:Carboxylesterase 1C-like isoform X2 n=1 Tax=Elysia marginata TaxID=1093978 RepID=A0AAV4JC64_9GAST|nr:carboxylesterase 1C-like isoform X2 [Elysia marginata]